MAKQVPVTPAAQPGAFASSRSSRSEVLAAVAADDFIKPESAEAVQSGPTSQDAELLALIGEFSAIEAKIEAICIGNDSARAASDWEPDPVDDPVSDALYAEQRPAFEAIMSTRALTLEGVQAKARMLNDWDEELARDGAPGGLYRPQMTLRLVQDLINLPD